jgi:hypothetical protein
MHTLGPVKVVITACDAVVGGQIHQKMYRRLLAQQQQQHAGAVVVIA